MKHISPNLGLHVCFYREGYVMYNRTTNFIDGITIAFYDIRLSKFFKTQLYFV